MTTKIFKRALSNIQIQSNSSEVKKFISSVFELLEDEAVVKQSRVLSRIWFLEDSEGRKRVEEVQDLLFQD